MEKILLLIGYLCVAGTIKSLGFVPPSFSYFDIWILALNFLIAVYLLRTAIKSARWFPEKFFVVHWLIRKNQKLKHQVSSLQCEVQELNSEIATLVDCWVPRTSHFRASASLKIEDLQHMEPKASLKSHNFGLPMDFAESTPQVKSSEPSLPSAHSQQPDHSEKQSSLSF